MKGLPLVLVLFMSITWAMAEEGCLRCHGMSTLALRDPVSGQLRDFHVDGRRFRQSLHGQLACEKCHLQGYDEFPHESAGAEKADSCLSCHKTPGKWDNLRLSGIADQFAKSVHFKAFRPGSGCFTCHDIHAPDTLGQDIPMGKKVDHANQRCRECHAGDDTPLGVDSLAMAHGWLPETQRHLAEVRCVDCHTQDVGSAIHAIGAARLAERRCESCHGKNSLLMAKLYRHRVLEERHKGGFLNSVVLNEAYVIGVTRNPWLDWASLGLVVLVVAGLAGHGLTRWLMAKRRGNHEQHH